MSKEKTRSILEEGNLFKVKKDKFVHKVVSFGGYIMDEQGKIHDISKCVVLLWTKEDIKKIEKKKKDLMKMFCKK